MFSHVHQDQEQQKGLDIFWDDNEGFIYVVFNPHLCSSGSKGYSLIKILLNPKKFLGIKVVKKLVFLAQSIVFLTMFSNLWNNNDFVSFLADYFCFTEIEYP